MSRNRISEDGRLQDYHPDVAKIWRSRNEELEQEVFDRLPLWMLPVHENIDVNIDLRRLLPEILETLTRREQVLIWCRYWKDYTLDEVGNSFGVTRERIRQVEAKALRRLHHPSRCAKLIPLVDTFPEKTRKEMEHREACRKAGEEAAKQAAAKWEEDWLLRKLLRLKKLEHQGKLRGSICL